MKLDEKVERDINLVDPVDGKKYLLFFKIQMGDIEPKEQSNQYYKLVI